MKKYAVSEYGNKEWRNSKGELHRTDGPAVEGIDGDKKWFINNKRHRTDGPAVEFNNGEKYWYADGKLHRFDGPAIEWADGDKWWFIDGVHLSEEDFNNHPKRANYLFQLELEKVL